MKVKKKKLCVIVPAHWEKIMGGSQYQAKVLVDSLLQESRYEIYYLTSVLEPSFEPEGYKIIRVAERKGIRRYGYFFDSHKLSEILHQIKPDIIYQRVGCGWTGIAAHYAKKNNCNMVWHVAHDRTLLPFERYISFDIAFRYLERKFLEFGIKNASRIVAQTTWQKDQLSKQYGRDAVVIPNFHPQPQETIKKNNAFKIIWVANLKKWKRPDVFVQLARAFSNEQNIEFVMAGRNMLTPGELDGLLTEIEETPNLSYLGECSQDKVNQLMAESHIFVNTSQYEGFANTFIQAWMRRTAVVSYEVDPDELLSRSGNGLLASGDFELLKKQIMTLVKNDSKRESLADKAYEYAMENHSVENVQKLTNVLEA